MVPPHAMNCRASLNKKSWLRRVIGVDCGPDQRGFRVEYNGRRPGYEQVAVDGRVVCRRISWKWLVPLFEFQLDGVEAIVRVRVSPWLTIRSFALIIAGVRVYSEGPPFASRCPICGYSQQGSVNGVCAECGRRIDADR